MAYKPTPAGPRSVRELFHYLWKELGTVGKDIGDEGTDPPGEPGHFHQHVNILSRDAADSHPQSAITDLLPDQAVQDAAILANLEAINANLLRIITLESERMRFLFDYVPYQTALRNDMAYDDGWLMVCNTDTTERAAPQATGPNETILPDDPTWAGLSQEAVVDSGHYYEFAEGGWFTTIRVWPAETGPTVNYKLYTINVTDPNNPTASQRDLVGLTAGQWNTVIVDSVLVGPQSRVLIYLQALNSAASTQVTGGWRYDGADNNNAPNAEGWNRNTQQTVVRIDKTDLATADRTAELLGIIPGSTLLFAQTSNPLAFYEYVVRSTTDSGSDVEYAVTLIGQGTEPVVGQPCTLTADVPVSQPTQYVREDNAWPGQAPTWATVQGFLQFDGVPENSTSALAAFGVDIGFTPGISSDDWSPAALSNIGSARPPTTGASFNMVTGDADNMVTGDGDQMISSELT